MRVVNPGDAPRTKGRVRGSVSVCPSYRVLHYYQVRVRSVEALFTLQCGAGRGGPARVPTASGAHAPRRRRPHTRLPPP